MLHHIYATIQRHKKQTASVSPTRRTCLNWYYIGYFTQNKYNLLAAVGWRVSAVAAANPPAPKCVLPTPPANTEIIKTHKLLAKQLECVNTIQNSEYTTNTTLRSHPHTNKSTPTQTRANGTLLASPVSQKNTFYWRIIQSIKCFGRIRLSHYGFARYAKPRRNTRTTFGPLLLRLFSQQAVCEDPICKWIKRALRKSLSALQRGSI